MMHAAHYLYISGHILPYPLIREIIPNIFEVEQLRKEMPNTVFESGYIALLTPEEVTPDRLPFPAEETILSDYSHIIRDLLTTPRRLVRIHPSTR